MLANDPSGLDDPYKWLENSTDTSVTEWIKAHNRTTTLALCDSQFATDREQLCVYFDDPHSLPVGVRKGKYFYNFWRDVDHVKGIWRRIPFAEFLNPEPVWETVLDIDDLSRQEKCDWTWSGCKTLEPDHEYGLVSLSRGGSDAVAIREFDLKQKIFVESGFAIPESKGTAEWLDINTILVISATRADIASSSGYARVVRRLCRGQTLDEARTVFAGTSSDVSVSATVCRVNNDLTIVYRRQMTFFDQATFLAFDNEGIWALELPPDAEVALFRDWILVKLRSDFVVNQNAYKADGLIVIKCSDFRQGNHDFQTVFQPSERRTLLSYCWGADCLILTVADGDITQVIFAVPGDPWTFWKAWESNPNMSVHLWPLDDGSMVRTDEFLMLLASYIEPPTLLLLDRYGLKQLKRAPAAFNSVGMKVVRHYAKSTDGTSIPYVEIGYDPTNKPQPAVLFGYGGFGQPIAPTYLGLIGKLWLELGYKWIFAGVRGGGEYGAEWHKAGMREGKKLSHEDFAAVALDLINRGVTKPELLAAHGGSNGGLMVGNMLTRYYGTFGAIWCTSALLDMRRYTQLFAGRSWIVEFGDPDNPEDWNFMVQFSPYHNLVEQRCYPPSLFIAFSGDDRVHPAHSRKMVAKLEDLNQRVLFYEIESGGHGIPDHRRAAFLVALGFSFLRRTIAAGLE